MFENRELKTITIMTILVTGSAGFIGSRVALMLAQRGDTVVVVDATRAERRAMNDEIVHH